MSPGGMVWGGSGALEDAKIALVIWPNRKRDNSGK